MSKSKDTGGVLSTLGRMVGLDRGRPTRADAVRAIEARREQEIDAELARLTADHDAHELELASRADARADAAKVLETAAASAESFRKWCSERLGGCAGVMVAISAAEWASGKLREAVANEESTADQIRSLTRDLDSKVDAIRAEAGRAPIVTARDVKAAADYQRYRRGGQYQETYE